MSAAASLSMGGDVSPQFEPVRKAFAENFTERSELGGACCVYHRGQKVVDLWGGVRNARTGEPWAQDTMVIVYSATKGLAAMTLAIAHSRGWLDYDERVCRYWPEFAHQGKERITVRQLLAHQAGLHVLDVPITRGLLEDFDRLSVVLANQKPAWEPGTRQAYHAITLGFYESELLRRIDPQHRSLGRFFEDEIATPLGLNLYIRLPQGIPNSRLATMVPPTWAERLRGFPVRLALDAMNRRSNISRALRGSELPLDERHVYARNLEVPSGGAVGAAQAIARAYSMFATGGRELGLRPETLALLAAPAVPPTRGFYDECMKMRGGQFSLGFMKSNAAVSFGSPGSFGGPGAGGALGFADPAAGIGYAYVTNRMGTRLAGDPRDVALRHALDEALRASKAVRGSTQRGVTVDRAVPSPVPVKMERPRRQVVRSCYAAVDMSTLRFLLTLALFQAAPTAPQLPTAREVAPDTFLVPGAMLPDRGPDGNTVIVVAPQGLIVIDTGRHPWHSDGILAFARDRRQPVAIIVNTHWHLDHSSGNGRVKAQHPAAKVYTTTAVDRALAPGGFLARNAAAARERPPDPKMSAVRREETDLFLRTMERSETLRPDVPVDRSGTLGLAGRTLSVRVAADAVTDADVWLYDEATGVAVIGDLVTLPAPFFETACPGRWQQALDEVWATPFRLAVPGHGAPMSRSDFDVYRRAFSGFRGCVGGDSSPATCAARWTEDVGALLASDAERRQASEYAAYYVDFLRKNGGTSAECRVK